MVESFGDKKNAALLGHFLASHGFVLFESETSECFGDYFYTYTKGEIAIRISCSKSFELIDVCNRIHHWRWIDIALMKALKFKEQDLNTITKIDEEIEFVFQNIQEVCELLSGTEYYSTIELVEEYKQRRVKQMFPNWWEYLTRL